jgi:hypothetical protein
MSNRCYPLVRGRRARATRLDACGAPVLGPGNAVVTDGLVSVGLTANIREGETIEVTNANGETCVLDEACPEFTNYGVEVAFCNVNPALYNIMSSQPLVTNGANTVGFKVNSGVKVCDAGFALELWTGIPADACVPGVGQSFGYMLLPFIRNGVLGDVTWENAAISFTLSNAITKNGSQWVEGPYEVILADTANEIQTVEITGSPTGGNITLTFSGETTANIARNASATTVKNALEALPNIGVGDVTVTGGPGPDSPWVVTFTGAYAGTDVPAMTVDDSGLTGGTTPAASVTTDTAGNPGVSSALVGDMIITTEDHLLVIETTLAPPDADCDPIAVGVRADTLVAGIPGYTQPEGTYAASSLADLLADPQTASPLTAWTTGQYVTLLDGSHAYWDSTTWVAGEAP